jgi:hypothetical protein
MHPTNRIAHDFAERQESGRLFFAGFNEVRSRFHDERTGLKQKRKRLE